MLFKEYFFFLDGIGFEIETYIAQAGPGLLLPCLLSVLLCQACFLKVLAEHGVLSAEQALSSVGESALAPSCGVTAVL